MLYICFAQCVGNNWFFYAESDLGYMESGVIEALRLLIVVDFLVFSLMQFNGKILISS
jgi:hypothetical protein